MIIICYFILDLGIFLLFDFNQMFGKLSVIGIFLQLNRIWVFLYIVELFNICISNYEGISMVLLEVKISFRDYDKEILVDVLRVVQFVYSSKKKRILVN